MRFFEVLAQVIGLLVLERRVSYRALKRQFDLDDAYIEDLKIELIEVHQLARDHGGKILVWTDENLTTRVPTPLLSRLDDQPITHADQPSQITLPPTQLRSPEAERRQLTVMFCDLADSTTLSQQLDPEDLREVMRAYQDTAAEVIHQYEGYISQYLGDGLLVYFGWPVAHEDDAQRALYSGLSIVEAISTTLNPRLEREKGVRLAVRIGIHTGPVVVGEMGGGGRREHLATGETVNIASRLEGLAAPNTAVLSQVTARLVQGAFTLDNLGRHRLKGVAEPMPAYRVRAPIDVYAAEDETPSVGRPFLVGRDEEVGLLRRRWEQAKEGLGQVVLVGGEAGIGKSSLVEVLRAQVRQEGLPRIAFRCSSYHRNSALYPVITHVERLLHFNRSDASTTKLDKLEQGLRPYSLPLDEVIPLFAALLSVPLDGRYPALTLTPQQQKQQTLDALVAWMLEEAERQPVLVAWEDLHWADPSTLEMLGLVLEQTPTVPMLHVLTYRPEFVLSWSTRSHMTPITLNRLERPQVEALITHLASGKALPSEVVEHIVAKTDGVPLYVEELTKMLLGSDLLREDAEQYVLTGPLLTVAIPDTLQDSLMARLDQLNRAKEVVQLGAVLGREFSYEMLRAISSQDEETVQAGLAQLVATELLYQRGRPPRAAYIFKHALVRDAAYQSLLKRTRQHVHQRVAQVLEEQFPDMAATQPELVAHHFMQGEVWAKVMAYSTLAGDRAADAFANAEAQAHYAHALQAAAQVTPPPDPAGVAHLHAKHGAILNVLGELDESVAAYHRALARIRLSEDQRGEIEILVGLGGVYNNFHRPEPAIATVEQALAMARELDDRASLSLCLANRVIIRAAGFGQLVETTSDAEEALHIAREMGEPKLLAQALIYLGWVLQWRAAFDRSLAYLHEGVELAQHTHAGFLFSQAVYTLGHANAARGAYEDALQWYQRLSSYASEAGDKAWLARVPNIIGGIHLELFDLDEALRLNLEGNEVAQQLFPWPEPRGHSLVKAGLAYLYQGEYGQAEAIFHRAWALLEKDAWLRWRWHIALLRARGELALAQGQYDEAWTYATQSLDLATQTDSRKHMARAQLLQGDVLTASGRLQEAMRTLQASVRLAEQIQTPREVWLGQAALGKVMLHLGQEKEAEAHFAQATQTIEAITTNLQTPRLRRSLLSAAPVLEVYKALGYRPPQAVPNDY